MSDRAERWAASLARAGFGGKLDPGAALAPLTTWRIGGPAELLATPSGRDDLVLLVGWCVREDVPYRILGNGSNLLVRDEGVRGIVVRVRRGLERLRIAGDAVEVEAGALFPALAHATATAGLAGLEFGAGVPGTVGGAVVMNAGWHEHEIGNFVERVEHLDAGGTPVRLDREACRFRYRGSALRDRPGTVLSVRLRLERDDPVRIRERLDRFATSRKENQPTSLPSCGSVFVQPPGDYAGRLIDRAGLKGTRVGAIEVSPVHANFFVNLGGGTAADVLALVERVEAEVERRFGVRLEREFELW